ncbi:rhodanese-like domain-containing protein [soil metagenome]
MPYPEESALPEVSAAEAVTAVRAGAYLIDVREQYEWDAGHAPQAHLVPMSALLERLGDIPAETPLLVICHSGMRSERVTEYLLREGYEASNVAGGMIAWNAAGGEIESDGPGTARV